MTQADDRRLPDAAPGGTAAPAKRVLIFPGLKDPRWFILAFLSCFVAYAISSPGFSRTPAQFLAGLAACLLLDSALLYFHKGRPERLDVNEGDAYRQIAVLATNGRGQQPGLWAGRSSPHR